MKDDESENYSEDEYPVEHAVISKETDDKFRSGFGQAMKQESSRDQTYNENILVDQDYHDEKDNSDSNYSVPVVESDNKDEYSQSDFDANSKDVPDDDDDSNYGQN